MSKCYDDPQLQELVNLTIYSIQREKHQTHKRASKKKEAPEAGGCAEGPWTSSPIYTSSVKKMCIVW